VTGDVAPETPDRREAETATDVRTPDAIEPIAAFRMWQADESGGLHSFNGQAVWEPGKWVVARCRLHDHEAPREGCSCGVYALKQLDGLLPGGFGSWSVLGRVELAGKVIEHSDGYRAERARIVELFPGVGQRPLLDAIAARSGVPIGREIPAPLVALPPGDEMSARTRYSANRSGYAVGLGLVALVNSIWRAMDTHGTQLAPWPVLAVGLASALGVCAWLVARRRSARRFSHQLRAYGTSPPADSGQ
jgi:hypothetical protein